MASTYLNRNASATATTFTYSVWLKRSGLASDFQYFFSYQSSGGGSNAYGLAFNDSTNKMYYYGTGGAATTDALFRDPAAWYHVVLSVTSGTGTLYVNNETVKSSISVNQVTSGEGMTIGAYKYGSTIDYQFDGYMAHAHFTDGYAYTPSTFGSTATNGQWVPNLAPSVTYGTNGFFLKFTNASDLGEDSSGNNNDFTKSGSGDKIPDCPANVFATFNPLDLPASMNLTNGGLSANSTANDMAATGNMGFTSGKWYWEFYWASGVSPEMGLKPNIKSLCNVTEVISSNFDVCSFVSTNASMRDPAWTTVDTTGLSSQTGESIIGVAVDADNGKMWFTNGSGTYFNSGNPATGANPQATFDSDWVAQTNGVVPYTLLATGGNKSVLVNFGQDSSFAGAKTAGTNTDENGNGNFYYSVPSGYNALCTNSMATELTLPIGKGDTYFNTTLVTSTGSDITINTGFKPDFLWTKSRSYDARHELHNTTSGDNKRLVSNLTSAEETFSDYMTFLSNGATFKTNVPHALAGGGAGRTGVAWSWSANGGTTASNTDGSITSTVQANTTAGFSIVTYTGNATNNATVGHGLGKTPKIYIVKRRDASAGWVFFTTAIDGTLDYLFLNDTASAGNLTQNLPTSSVFSLTAGSDNNASGGTFVSYVFAEIEGYSKIGKYTGNGIDNDGPFVYTGFKPAWLLVKNITNSGEWGMFDSARNTFNVVNARLEANSNGVEYSGDANRDFDFISNGFKVRNGSADVFNGSGDTYIYMAFAENPFVDSSGIPVTAR